MKRFMIAAVVGLAFSTVSFGREAYVLLTDYVTRAEAICVCTVEQDNGDKTVTVRVDQILKGELDKTEVLKGETGHCVIQGPVSHFMKPKGRYLVFVFKGNTVGRLGGILPINEDTLVARFIDGFTETTFDKKEFVHKLSLKKAIEQVKATLHKEKNVQPEDARVKGAEDETYQVYLVYHFKYYRHEDKECQQLLGSWIEVYFPKRRVIAKIVEINKDIFSVVRDGAQVMAIKKGIEIIRVKDGEKPYVEQRLQKHDKYRLSEMPLRIDCLKLTDSTLRDVLKELD